MNKTVEDVEVYIRNEAGKHNKEGELVSSVYKRKLGPNEWEVGHDLQIARHALFVHWGTKPHKIKPKGKAAGGKGLLRFVVGNRFVSKHEVNHPGNKPDKWLERAAQQAPLMFARHVEALLKKDGEL